MKLIYFSAVFSIFLFSYKECEVTSQAMHPYYGGPISYSDNDDDDIGILLTILLLAARNRSCGNSCCCSQNIPIPYPIPIPTNNPIITRYQKPADDDEDDDKNGGNKNGDEKNGGDKNGADKTGKPAQQINIITDNDQGAISSAGALSGATNSNSANTNGS